MDVAVWETVAGCCTCRCNSMQKDAICNAKVCSYPCEFVECAYKCTPHFELINGSMWTVVVRNNCD